eukprot:scaffold11809_cov128-Cylindrotheca_fusiformis.AAC.13
MRALDQNVRQRALQANKHSASDKLQRTPSRTSWDRQDDGYESTSSDNRVLTYNPLQLSDGKAEVPASPSSLPQSWYLYDQSKGSLRPGPVSLEGLRSSHHPSVAPPIIPDSSYQAYLKGRSFKRKRRSLIDRICLAKFCALFSCVAIMFLVFVGVLIDTQALYIPGVLESVQDGENQKVQKFYVVNQSERLPTASVAYQAAFFYFLTASASLAYAYNFHFWFNSRLGHYHDIPDADAEFTSDADLPSFHRRMKAYQHDNSIGSRLWNMTAATANRVKMQAATMWPKYRENRRARRRQMGAKDV